MAVTGAGEVVLNAAMSNGSSVPEAVLKRALDHGGKVFVGMVATAAEVTRVKAWIDDSTFELSGWVWGAREARLRKKKGAKKIETKHAVEFEVRRPRLELRARRPSSVSRASRA
jgi:hypothetical protein